MAKPTKPNLPGGFCEDCFKGTLRGDAKPAGREETIHGLPCYVARPDPCPPSSQPLGLVVVIPDAFGWKFLNTRALADAYARRGPFLVYVPEFMAGGASDPDMLVLADRLSHPSDSWTTALFRRPWWFLCWAAAVLPLAYRLRYAVARPRIWAFFEALRAGPPPPELASTASGSPDLKIGVAGFCWGGRYAALLCGDDPPAEDKGNQGETTGMRRRPLVDCGFTAHPSLLGIPGEVEAIRRPISVANGEDDQWLGREKMARLKSILEGGGGAHEVVVYEGATHGFAVRGDPFDPKQAEFGMLAEDQAVAWFQRQFTSAT